jgi:hypothetical protein
MNAIIFKSEFMFTSPIKLMVSIGMIFGFTFVLTDSILYSILSVLLVIVAYKLSISNGIYISEENIVLKEGFVSKTKKKYTVDNLKYVTHEYLYTTSYTNYLLVFYFEVKGVQSKFEVFTSETKEMGKLSNFLEGKNIPFKES